MNIKGWHKWKAKWLELKFTELCNQQPQNKDSSAVVVCKHGTVSETHHKASLRRFPGIGIKHRVCSLRWNPTRNQ